MTYLTESLEDYLVDIYEESCINLVARLKDIAKRRKVKLPSVKSAIKYLQERNLVRQQRYGYIVLTEEGIELARKIIARKKSIWKFLTEVLCVPEDIAQQDAHKMEHDLSEETLSRIVKLSEYFHSEPECKSRLREFMERKEVEGLLTLKDLKVSERGKIVRIEDAPIKARLLAMGAVPGTVVKVEKVAPLGDPIDVSLLGYHLSLRREEAEKIIVEKI